MFSRMALMASGLDDEERLLHCIAWQIEPRMIKKITMLSNHFHSVSHTA